MVYSHLNKSIEYPETREIDPEDIDHVSSLYLLEIYGNPHTVAIGKVKYTFSVTYEVVYFPIYLVRNTKIIDVVNSLKDYGVKIAIFDPWANIEEVKHAYSLQITNTLPNSKFDAIVLGVSHKEFLNINLASLAKETSVIYDVKGILDDSLVDGKL